MKKNIFSAKIIDPIIKHYLDKASTTPTNPGKLNTEHSKSTKHFKLPYQNASSFAQRKIKSLLKTYCINLQIRLAFSSCKVSNMFSIKHPIPILLRSIVVYKFSCAGCNSVYVGETCQHFSTRVHEYTAKDKISHICNHLASSNTCKRIISHKNSVTILDTANCSFQRKIKEVFHIN